MSIVVTETFRESYRSLNITHHIFSLNYNELKELLHQFKKTEAILLWDIRNQEDFRQFQIQILQKFHNFLASLKTFVDHTRVFVNEFCTDEEFLNEYNSLLREKFGENPLSIFIQDLRNFTLHKSLPIVAASLNLNDFSSTVCLEVSELMEWSGWKNGSKLSLENQEDEIIVEKIVDDYILLIDDFYGWFYRTLNELVYSKG